MSPLLTAALIIGSCGTCGNTISRHMGLSQRWRRFFTLTCALIPPVGFLLLSGTAALQAIPKGIRKGVSRRKKEKQAKEERLSRMSPKEKESLLRGERLKELKANLEKSEARVDAARLRSVARKDRLMGRSEWDETNLHGDWYYRHLLSRQAKAEIAFCADRRELQDHLLSMAKRETDSTQKIFSIRCNKLADGTLSFELPLDAGAAVINEMRIVLSRDWGVEMGNLSRARITEHRSNDFSTISLGCPRVGMEKDIANSTVFVYDRNKGTIRPAGEQLTEDTIIKVYNAMDDFRLKVKKTAKEPNAILDREDMKACLTLHTLGLDTVALAFNGVAIAYATASPDGGIHIKGDDVPVRDKKALKMASTVQEQLRDCQNFGQWLEKAIEILHSHGNVQICAKELERKAILEHSRKMMKELTRIPPKCRVRHQQKPKK